MNFNDKLQGVIYDNSNKFMKSLYSLPMDKLEVLLENIRSHLNIKRNADNFERIMSTMIIGFEKMGPKMGLHIEGLYEDLIKDLEY